MESWKGKFCPEQRLEASAVPSAIIPGTLQQVAEPSVEGRACLGPKCMKFVPIQGIDEKGQPFESGGCAIAVQVMALNAISQQLQIILEKSGGK